MSEPALAELLRSGVDALSRARVASAQADAELLLGHVLGLSRGEVQAKALVGARMPQVGARAFLEAVERRAAREPLQHITGVAAFRHLRLRVGPGVFVPRPETEMVAQLALDALLAVPSPEPVAIDLGTGSGAIALALATEAPHARVIAVENSPRAFVWARENVEKVGVSNLRLVFDDLARCLPELDGEVDVVVSNPPYIPDDAVPRDPEVRLHDPAAALYGGPDGLDVVRALSHRALALLRQGGALVLEHADEQGPALRVLLAADGWRTPATHRDLTGRDRATTAKRP